MHRSKKSKHDTSWYCKLQLCSFFFIYFLLLRSSVRIAIVCVQDLVPSLQYCCCLGSPREVRNGQRGQAQMCLDIIKYLCVCARVCVSIKGCKTMQKHLVDFSFTIELWWMLLQQKCFAVWIEQGQKAQRRLKHLEPGCLWCSGIQHVCDIHSRSLAAARRCCVMASLCHYQSPSMCDKFETDLWSFDALLSPRRNGC